MDENQDLSNPLVINSEDNQNEDEKENNIEDVGKDKQSVNLNKLRDLSDIDLYQILYLVEDLYSIPNLKFEEKKDEEEVIKQKDRQPRGSTQNLRKSRKMKTEKEIDLPSLYREILKNKVFEKKFTLDGQVDFVASRTIEVEEKGKSVVYDKILIQNRSQRLFYLTSNNPNNSESKSDLIVIQGIENLDFEYFEFSVDGNFIIFGNRGLIVLWDINTNSIIDVHEIDFKSPEFMEWDISAGKLKNYKSLVMNDGNLNINYSVGKFIFKITINTVNDKLIVKISSCDVFEVPSYTYINNEESLIAVVITGKDKIVEGKKYIKTIHIINSENMKIEKHGYEPNFKFIENIFFKFTVNGTNMELYIIRLYEKKLYLNQVSIKVSFQVKGEQNSGTISTVENEKLGEIEKNDKDQDKETKFIVNCNRESPLFPEFFLKNNVQRIENSILNTLCIEYISNLPFKTLYNKFFTKSSEPQPKNTVLMDFNLKTKIKDLENFDEGKAKLLEKFIIKYSNSTITIFSQSDFKADPTLEITENNKSVKINKIRISLPFIFVSTDSKKVHCYKLLLTQKGNISHELTKEDIKIILPKLDNEKRKKIIASFVDVKDARNLQVYLDWKIEVLTPENFEPLPIYYTISKNTLACTEILLQFILKIDEDFPKMKMIIKEIESNLKKIISSGCPSIPQLLDKFFVTKIESGTPKSENLPMYLAYEFKGISFKGYFFVNSTENDKDYEVKYSFIKVPDKPGTLNSLELTRCLCLIEDMKVFGTDFIKAYIRSKWEELRLPILLMTFFLWVNILLVACLVSNLEGEIYFYLFVGVNCFLAIAELIQAINLGIEQYIGIKNIMYSSILQLLTSIFLILVYCDSFVFAFFAFLQVYTIQKLFDISNEIEKIVATIFLGLPFYIYLVILIFTSDKFYFILIFGICEIVIYIASYFAGGILLGMRLGLQCLGVIFFTFYSIENVYLLFFNLFLLLCETGYLVKLVKNAECKMIHIFDYIICLISKLLVLAAFTESNVLYAYFGIFNIVMHTLVRTAAAYMEEVGGKSLQRLEIMCYRYCTYLLFAYFITEIIEFGYCFIIFNIIDFLWVRSNSFKGLINSTIQLMANWNTLDILRYTISVIWVLIFKSIKMNLAPTEEEKLNFKYLTWLFVLLNLIKALLGFRAFDTTRFYVRLIFKCVVDIIPFLIIFVSFTLSFGLLNVVEKSRLDFKVLWKDPFDQSLGGFTHDDEEDILGYFMFSIGSLLIVIIMLNLLISILAGTYAKFLVEVKQIDYKVMIEAIYDVEVLLLWRSWLSNSVKYFASCNEIKVSGEEINTAWQLKLNTIEEKFNASRDELSGEISKISSKLDEVIKLFGKKEPNDAEN